MEGLPVARQTSVTLLDDIDGSRAAETVVFGIDGASYQIDLSKRNAASLRKALTEFVENGRRVTDGARLNKRMQRRTRPAGATPAMIRARAAISRPIPGVTLLFSPRTRLLIQPSPGPGGRPAP